MVNRLKKSVPIFGHTQRHGKFGKKWSEGPLLGIPEGLSRFMAIPERQVCR